MLLNKINFKSQLFTALTATLVVLSQFTAFAGQTCPTKVNCKPAGASYQTISNSYIQSNCYTNDCTKAVIDYTNTQKANYAGGNCTYNTALTNEDINNLLQAYGINVQNGQSPVMITVNGKRVSGSSCTNSTANDYTNPCNPYAVSSSCNRR